MTTKIFSTLETIDADAMTFLDLCSGKFTFAFSAEMGAGKTTFIQRVLAQLGVHQLEGSPTYGFVNNYQTEKNGLVFHLDLYRLNSEEEAYDIGIEDIIYDQNYCFIEWPDIIRNLLPSNTVWVTIKREDNNARTICIEL
jgi:tRNA threonylcarbamoyladenosine biosynthesis protein TsaE